MGTYDDPSNFFLYNPTYRGNGNCSFVTNDDGVSVLKFGYNECGTQVNTADGYINYNNAIFYENPDASGRVYTFSHDYAYRFKCQIPTILGMSTGTLSSASVGVDLSGSIGAIRYSVTDTDTGEDFEILLAPDIDPNAIPIVPEVAETEPVTVDVSHNVSIVLPLQPEWWLQIVDEAGSEDEMEVEICL